MPRARGQPVKRRWTSIFTALLWLQGTSMPAGAPWVREASADTIGVGVTPISFTSPAAVTDLLASGNPAVEGQISLTWTAPQGNAGGVPINNQTVAAYTVRYATFSVASLAGDTTAWWTHPGVTSTSLSPPGYSPKPPGSLEAWTFSGLTPGVTFYFALKSRSASGVDSPIDALAATPSQQASAWSTQLSVASTPRRPNGLSFAGGPQFQLGWTAVTRDVNGQDLAVVNYRVDRYASIGSVAPQQSVLLPPTATAYTETVGSQTYFFRVVAIGLGGVTSAPSDFVDSSAAPARYAIAADDSATRLVIPALQARDLVGRYNAEGKDLEIRVLRRSQDEINATLRSYRFAAFDVGTDQEEPAFVFGESGVSVELGYGAALGSTVVGQSPPARAQAGSIAQIIAVYWNNGQDFVKISDPVLTSNQSLSVRVRNIGIYQVRATRISNSFRLAEGSPYPRVITPNGAENRRVFFFFDNPSDELVQGTIYDIRGAVVRELRVDSQSPTSSALVWDGRDAKGAVVPSGVYLYKITAGKEKATGTVVVAR